MKFGEKILVLAKKRGTNLKEIAQKADIPYSTLRSYIQANSKNEPPASKAINLAKGLGVSIEWLFDDSQEGEPPPYHAPPPFQIYPWPPDVITWKELQYAIAVYRLRKAIKTFYTPGIQPSAEQKARIDIFNALNTYSKYEQNPEDISKMLEEIENALYIPRSEEAAKKNAHNSVKIDKHGDK